MEELQFIVEDQAIVELFGRQNFSVKESALFELIKNSYDAGATECNIIFSNEDDGFILKINDNGLGMNETDIKTNWMTIGKSEKKDTYIRNERVLSGSKGVGRLALARLGHSIELISKKAKENAICWKTNWNNSTLEEISWNGLTGTRIKISGLRDNWKKNDVIKLGDFLSRVCFDKKMSIKLKFDQDIDEITPIFENAKLGHTHTQEIILKYDSEAKELEVSIESDEFKDAVKELVSPLNIKKSIVKIPISSTNPNITEEEEEKILKEIGNFSAVIYFALDVISTEDFEKFNYKYKNLSNKFKTGIILYRNSFSIYSLEGSRDWLDLGARARKSPAAATHLTGAWRARSNQLSGYINIDKFDNPYLIDLANRQGLEENLHYELFKEIIANGLKEFERYRQNIIKEIAKSFPLEEEFSESAVLDTIIKNPDAVKMMSRESVHALAVEVSKIKEDRERINQKQKEQEEKHRYEMRILNVLATQGLKANVVAHEYHADRNKLAKGVPQIIKALEQYGMWTELNSLAKTKFTSRNVPSILEAIQKINNKLGRFLDIFLKGIERKVFTTSITSLEETIRKIIDEWDKQYDWVTFNFEFKNIELPKYIINADIINVIFDNLILNSIQNNEEHPCLVISIEVFLVNSEINVIYKDNGKGLDSKYKDNPKRILEVHETSRKDGHGLGMWIINTTLLSNSGNVIRIAGDNGFLIEFGLLGGKE